MATAQPAPSHQIPVYPSYVRPTAPPASSALPARPRPASTLASQKTAAAPRPAAKTTASASSKSKKPPLPAPPRVIIDSDGRHFKRGDLLGQGGFARVYMATDPEGRQKAFKVIAKSAIIHSRKSRQKVLAEIMIHKSVNHIHVVNFEDCFEDDENVYFRLELCCNGSLNDIVKKRGPYTEPEARYLMVQILAGTQSLHQNSIIHRDLKLGNIFLDQHMHVKIGDFGLAALLKHPDERKKTVCGTPNYIAPEILYDQGQGHSFEVDIWSVGVILYTLLVGKPPFQTPKVDDIYERIRKNAYEIPAKAGLSNEAVDLITRILTHNPAKRPTLVQIMNHPWFQCGPVPLTIPPTALEGTPFLPPVTARESARNLEMLKRQANWNDRADDLLEDAAAAGEAYADAQEPVEVVLDARSELEQAEHAEERREKMDREAHHAIQPESPISALLKAGRQPLIKAPAPPPQSLARSTASSLAKQLSSLTLSRHTQPAVADKENANPMAPPPPAAAARPEFGRMYSRNANAGVDDDNARALQQKARLVTSVAAPGSLPTRPLSTASSMGTLAEQAMVPSSSRGTLASVGSSSALAPGAKKTKTSIEVIIAHLDSALTCIDANEPYDAPATSAADTVRYVETSCDLNGTRLVAESPRTFLISWLDHSERYGLGYALSDGTVGVYFRDATSMVLAASKMYVDYISTIRKPAGGVRTDQLKRENFTTGDGEEGSVPRELQSRVRVMRYFEKEIMDRLYGADSPLTFCDTARTSGMVFVHKWYKTKDAIVFRLSNGTVQLNFYDHTKLFLTHGAQVVSVIEPLDKTGGVPRMTSWSLDEFVSIARTDRSAREAQMSNTTDRTLYKTRPAERRKVRGLVNKLRYARDVLASTVKPNRPS
ncbi:pkinase-domain-containing protein [Moesziomyces antarcticus]|uniref:Serine/threonine-protein kinase n=2 Tax=Pseudozyma antarctica TaxID=84753 RepID=A0A081CDK4_PSEA2|nr:pkinase-domain-containing protein [Moesziomyces antarcticus]GAK64750.1 pkinase-domain-containing protein [Moesziomyces antarcticus]SPO45738.1 related to CDC5 - Serine/threonine-protein kinase [Moesziomyces antarcticus]